MMGFLSRALPPKRNAEQRKEPWKRALDEMAQDASRTRFIEERERVQALWAKAVSRDGVLDRMGEEGIVALLRDHADYAAGMAAGEPVSFEGYLGALSICYKAVAPELSQCKPIDMYTGISGVRIWDAAVRVEDWSSSEEFTKWCIRVFGENGYPFEPVLGCEMRLFPPNLNGCGAGGFMLFSEGNGPTKAYGRMARALMEEGVPLQINDRFVIVRDAKMTLIGRV